MYLAYYGPVAAVNDSLPLADIQFHRPYRPYIDGVANWADANAVFEVTIDDTKQRRLKIVPKLGMSKMPGEYRVRTNTSNVVCDAIVTGSPAAQDAEYWFWLAFDCNLDNAAGPGDFLQDANCDPVIDCNCNGIDDVCDVRNGNTPHCGSGCACDFNTTPANSTARTSSTFSPVSLLTTASRDKTRISTTTRS